MFTRTTKAAQISYDKPVAYFCAEYGISDILPIYSGGLGVLAGDIVQQAAAAQVPLVSIGLFYRLGYFHQRVDWTGQHESPQPISPGDVPLELLKDASGETLLIEVPIHERTVFAQVWRFPLSERNSLYLLDTDHWRNNESDRAITDQLYSGTQEKRIQQELVLGIGGYRLLQALNIEPSLFHMNEGHSAFLALELLRVSLAAGKTLDTAIVEAKRQLLFTNHTLVAAGNDMFPHETIRYYLGKYAHESGIGIGKVLELGAFDGQPGVFAVTMFALRLAGMSNAVSKLHAKKAVEIWPQFKFQAITNGVHLPAWIAPELQSVLDQQLPGWAAKASDQALWKSFRKVPAQKLWETHMHLKERMLDEVYARTGIRLESDVLTVVWARRFASYKRPDLLFSDLERLKKLLFHADRPIQVIVSGKSHPADGRGKEIIEMIDHLAQYELKHRAVFVDDYSISLSKFLVSGADIWLNTPIFGLEASGTSGMKAASNGVLQFTVPDGWAYEVDWYGLGFTLPQQKAEKEIYELFEKKVVPSYYKRDKDGLPQTWLSMMRETIATIPPRFSSQRMVEDYVSKMYEPSLKG